MPDIFLSYSREDQAVARRYAEAFQAEGFDVWWDVTLRSGEAYDQVTENALREAKAVVVLWSKTSVASRWVRAEATQANRNKTLVPAMIEPCERPIMFELTQTAELSHWQGNIKDDAWCAFIGDVRRFVEAKSAAAVVTASTATPATKQRKQDTSRKISICVLPFSNMSGDTEQEYFSDGISEDIITDLSKVSALDVISRNSAFMYKGKNVDLLTVARELKVTHVLEGSVRKSGGRVRITAQLIDGSSNAHVWADRYDRDLDDIFALQDEISQAIVKAMKVKLLPEEKKAIERRGTDNVEAYNLYLLARQEYASGFHGDRRRNETIIRLCQRATEIDPNYASAWALIALAQSALELYQGDSGDGGLEAVERALSLDPGLAEAHAVKARILCDREQKDEATKELEIALRLNPASYEVNKNAAAVYFTLRRLHDAIGHWQKAVELVDTDFSSAGLLVTCYTALGDEEGARRAAELTLARCEKILAQDRGNGTAMGHGSDALAVLGQGDRAKEWMSRALLISPDNLNMRYNFACALAVHLKDADAALDMLEPVFTKFAIGMVNYAKIDPDLDSLRDLPRFQAMVAAAEARLVAEAKKPSNA